MAHSKGSSASRGIGEAAGALAAFGERPEREGRWSESALRVLKERYLKRDATGVKETPEEMCWRVAAAIAKAEERWGKSASEARDIAESFYDVMVEGQFVPNSPTMMNAGKDNGLQYSACFVLPVDDSMDGIFEAVKRAAIIHKSGGGCIAADARVWTTFCGLEPIEVLVNRAIADGRPGVRKGDGYAYDVGDLGIQTISMNPSTGETGLCRVTDVWQFDVPADQQVMVKTREGTRVQTSAWHPFMVVRPEGLVPVPADALTPGDVILGPDRPDSYWPYQAYRQVGSLTLDESLGWLVGFTLGDGSFGYVSSLRQYRLRWFSGASDVLERVRLVLGSKGIHTSIQRDARGLLSIATLTQRFVLDMLEACALQKIGPKDDRVRVPEVITKSPLPVIRAFVAGLLDSDGYVAPDGSPSYSTASEEMAEDLAGLMSVLGYQPFVSAKPPRGRGKRTVFSVQLCNLPQVNGLKADLAPYVASARKLARLHSASRKQLALRLPFRPWRDRLKAIGLIPKNTRMGAGRCSAELSRWSCNSYRRCRRDDLLKISDTVLPLDSTLGNLLRRVANRGMEIETVGLAAQPRKFYDLTVEGWNTYGAGSRGMTMVHNTGFAFSRLRPKDTMVKSTGGKASGPVSFLRVFNGATEAVKQGGTRRGANMGILRVDHPDILEFIDSKLDGGITNFNISVAATEKFMDALAKDENYELIDPHTQQVTGHLRAREVFTRIVQAAWRTGDPGMVFIDRINASPANPVPRDEVIEATNPCIAGDALVPTDRGLLRMEALVAAYGQGGVAVQVDSRLTPAQLLVWEGTHNVPLSAYDLGCLPITRAFCSGERETVTVRTKAGFELTCTPDHRFMTERGWVSAADLKTGVDRVFVQSDPGVFATDSRLPFTVVNEFHGRNRRVYRHALPTTWSREIGLVLGWLIGDGWLRWGDKNCRVGFTFGAEDLPVAETLKPILDGWYGRPVRIVERARGVRHLSYHGRLFIDFFRALGVRAVDADKKVVPETLFAAPREAVIGFLQAFFTTDGTVRDNPQGNSSWIALTSKSRDLLRGVQLLLLNLGIKSQILDRSRPPRVGLFVAQGTRTYGSDGILFELAIFGQSRDRFRREIGFLDLKQRRLENVRYRRFYTQRFSDVAVSVEASGVRKVYDLTEPQSHSMIANGLVVHQCGEQPLGPNDACNLGSINLAKFYLPSIPADANAAERIDWVGLERVVRTSVRFLDDVIEVNPYPLQDIIDEVRNNRRIGLGIMGWADLLLELGIPYDSDEALRLGEEVMGFIQRIGHDASESLAVERGPFPRWSRSIYKDGKPLRNSTVTTIAPTGTISIIANCSSGIEPIFAVAFSHIVGDRHLTFVNPIFEEVAKRRGFYSEKLMQKVAEKGVVRGIEGVPEDVQRVFVTAHEIDPVWHVKMQAAFQKQTDNGVSKTINMPNSATPDDIAQAYLMAYDMGCLGITVFRDGCKDTQVLHLGTGGKGERKEVKEVPEAAPAVSLEASLKVKPRPRTVKGVTYRAETPLGTAFITVNQNVEGEPFEVFANVGKAGSDTAAVSEAIGRLISLALRLPSPMSPRERVEQIVNQLSGIGGRRPMGMGKDRVRSLPDAIAQVLSEHIGLSEPGIPELLEARGKTTLKAGDMCPDCGLATLVYEEGCQKCYSCGFSEC
jgi:ribonucleoside-diphosphate reductase alpha chain